MAKMFLKCLTIISLTLVQSTPIDRFELKQLQVQVRSNFDHVATIGRHLLQSATSDPQVNDTTDDSTPFTDLFQIQEVQDILTQIRQNQQEYDAEVHKFNTQHDADYQYSLISSIQKQAQNQVELWQNLNDLITSTTVDGDEQEAAPEAIVDTDDLLEIRQRMQDNDGSSG